VGLFRCGCPTRVSDRTRTGHRRRRRGPTPGRGSFHGMRPRLRGRVFVKPGRQDEARGTPWRTNGPNASLPRGSAEIMPCVLRLTAETFEGVFALLRPPSRARGPYVNSTKAHPRKRRAPVRDGWGKTRNIASNLPPPPFGAPFRKRGRSFRTAATRRVARHQSAETSVGFCIVSERRGRPSPQVGAPPIAKRIVRTKTSVADECQQSKGPPLSPEGKKRTK